jgi:hypothetical protein
VPVHTVPVSRRHHDRLDLSERALDAWLVADFDRYLVCRLLNLSFAGMCLHAEDLFELGGQYRFILDLTTLLGTEVEVTARIVWKRSMEAGLCYLGAVFEKSSAPWLGPDED